MPPASSLHPRRPAADLLPVDDTARRDRARARPPTPPARSPTRRRRLPPAARVDRRPPRRDAGRVLIDERLAAGARLPGRGTSSPATAAARSSRRRPTTARSRSCAAPAPTSGAVPLDADGIDVDRAGRAARRRPAAPPRLRRSRPIQNPSGACASLARRAARWSSSPAGTTCFLVEDDPYGLLRFEGDSDADAARARRRRAGRSTAPRSRRRSRPGVRTGVPGPARARSCGRSAVLSENTHIGPNTLAEAIVCGVLRRRPVRAQRRAGDRRAARAPRRDGGGARASTSPRDRAGRRRAGGYFFWVDLPDGIDTTDALAAAAEQGVPYVQGGRLLRRRGRPQLAAAGLQRRAPPTRSARASPGSARCSRPGATAVTA